VEVADAQRLFSPEGTYLNTASYGLPPRQAWEALQSAQDEWRHGRTLAPHGMPGQSWNAAGYLMAEHSVVHRVNPLEMRPIRSQLASQFKPAAR